MVNNFHFSKIYLVKKGDSASAAGAAIPDISGFGRLLPSTVTGPKMGE